MYYLSACNKGLFQRNHCYILFLLFKKFFKYYETIFLIRTSLLTNKRNKCIIGKINLYFLTSQKMVKFFLQKFVIFNTITDSFSVEKWETLELVRRYVCENLLNLNCHCSIRFGIFQVVCKWIIIWEHFLLFIFYTIYW